MNPISNRNNRSAGIIGGGISGLAAAHALRERGVEVAVYESTASPGGMIKTLHRDEWLLEMGPNTLMDRTESLRDLIQKLNLESEVLRPGPEAKKRFIVKEGEPVPLPSSLSAFIASGLFSPKGKFRLLAEPFISRGPSGESVAGFFARRLGREIVDYAVDPFISGIYAGDPEKLSMKHTFPSLHGLEQQHGSLLTGGIKSLLEKRNRKPKKDRSSRGGLLSFKEGIYQLAEALAEDLGESMHCSRTVTRIKNGIGHPWNLEFSEVEGTAQHDAVIFTAPMHRIPFIEFEMEQSGLMNGLAEMRYAPVAAVAIGFPRDRIEHPLDGFGVLVPDVEPYRILGCLFSSSLFRGRAPENHVLLTCFVGGDRKPELTGLPESNLRDLVLRDLRSLLGCRGEPVLDHIQTWEKAIPQYTLEHQTFLDRMDRVEQQNPGFFLTGNFRYEISVPGCIDKAHETASRAASFLQSQ